MDQPKNLYECLRDQRAQGTVFYDRKTNVRYYLTTFSQDENWMERSCSDGAIKEKVLINHHHEDPRVIGISTLEVNILADFNKSNANEN